MSFNFSGLLNRKFKKINSKVRFVGIRKIFIKMQHKRTSILCSIGYGLLSSSEIEAGRKLIRKMLGKSKRIKILVRIFPYILLTGKPAEVRMGRGKGSKIRKWVCFVKPGKILYEIKNISNKRGKFILLKASEKLSVKTKPLSLFKMKSKKYFI